MEAYVHTRGARGEKRGAVARHGVVREADGWTVLVPGAMEGYVRDVLCDEGAECSGGVVRPSAAFVAAWEGAARSRRGRGFTRELSGSRDVMRGLAALAGALVSDPWSTSGEVRAARTVLSRLHALDTCDRMPPSTAIKATE